MNRASGVSAGTIALIAFFVHMAIPGGQEARVDVKAPAKTGDTDKKAKGSNKVNDSDGSKPEGPWLATQYFFGYSEPIEGQDTESITNDFTNARAVLSCDAGHDEGKRSKCLQHFIQHFGIASPGRIQFLIATVPDPLHTHLALFTDSSIQAIQNAATRAGWRFATEWLPWNDPINPDEKDPAKRRDEREVVRTQERQPGILVFRHKVDSSDSFNACQPVLFVFVIGETPTAGVNPTQFQLARAYMRAIQDPAEVRIQGPTFSGSFDSLARLIENDKVMAPKHYVVQSGTATDTGAANAFRKTPRVTFHSAIFGGKFSDVLSALTISQENAAQLIEDESGYGQSLVSDDAPIRTYLFPRDISHLRNAYREATQSKSNGAPQPELDFSIKDTETGEDSVPVFSKAHSPLSQNAVINEITGAIQRDRIRIVQINATNVLDLLFLTRVLKRQCPDTRILISSPDLLFIEAAQSEGLTGTLALSTYPLFAASNDWMGQKNRPAAFSDANSEGVYNATVMLLNAAIPMVLTTDRLAMLDYPWEVHCSQILAPQTWLLTLDREGFMPVQRFDDAPADWFMPVLPPRLPDFSLPAPNSLLVLLSGAVSLSIVFLATWIFVLALSDKPLRGAAFAIDSPHNPADDWRFFYLFLLILLLAAMLAAVWTPLWHRAALSASPEIKLLRGMGIVGFVATIAALFRVCLKGLRGLLPCCGAAASLFAIGAIVSLWIVCCFRGEPGFFFSFRVLELRLGTSPAWPVMAALAVLCAFAFVNLLRLYMVVYEIPEVEVQDTGAPFMQPLKMSYHELNSSLKSPIGLHTGFQWAWAGYVWLLLAAVFVVGRWDRQLSSIDGRPYNILSIGLTLTAVAILLVACSQVLMLWRSFHGFLACLNALPVATYFFPADKPGGNRPVWVKQLNVQSIDIHAHVLNVLREIASSRPVSFVSRPWKEWASGYSTCLQQRLSLGTRAKAQKNRQSMRKLSKTIAVEAFKIVQDHWPPDSLGVNVFDTKSPSEDSTGSGKQPSPETGTGTPKIENLANRFLALHYSPYLLYCVRQIRNLIVFLSVGFLLLVMCLSSYSHQSPQFIGRSLIVLFLVIGAVVLRSIIGMERDPILSRIAGTTPGQLGIQSYFKIAGFAALPVLGLIASQFPSISNFLYSWVAPTLQALH